MRTGLALARIALLYVALWGIGTVALLQVRADREAGAGAYRSLPPADSLAYGLPFAGVNVALEQYPARAERTQRLTTLRDIGFGWVRQRIDWGAVEPETGDFRWEASDAVIADILAAGLEPVIVLDGSPAWARAATDNVGNGNALAPPAHPQDFARFAAAFANRYAGEVRYYQIWDEPNIAPHWGNRWINPIEYAHMLRLAAAAIREADPDTAILLGALAPTADRGHLAMDEVYFLQRLVAAGAAPYFDAVAIQPLGFGRTPEDPKQQIDGFNLYRTVLVRRAMVSAGIGHKPLIAARFGWNRQPHSPWSAVSQSDQADFAARALELAYVKWPWLAGMAWAIDEPTGGANDPAWGFALNDELAATVAGWQAQTPMQRTQMGAPAAHAWQRWGLLALALALSIWRLRAALRIPPWNAWRAAYRSLAPPVHALLWALLLAAYLFATWPPLVVLCWAVAAALILAQPAHGLWLAAAVLPFYFQHKEMHWGEVSLAIAPSTAAALCLLPALAAHSLRNRRPAGRWDVLAVAWVAVVAASASGVWNWPAYMRGVVEFVLTPLVLYFAVRAFTRSGLDRRTVLIALTAGGALVAAAGLVQWLRGGGAGADSVRRLVGPYFSANHAALYLERTLFVAVGLALFYRAKNRWLCALPAAIATAIVAAALILTASRGAILLGIPSGIIVLALLAVTGDRTRSQAHPGARRTSVLSPGAIAVIALAAVVVTALAATGFSWERLGNSATIVQRWALWQSAAGLWREYWLAGVGPNGFLWRFPAHIPIGSPLDPNLLHPHNVWLEYATSGGVLAFIWLLAAVTIVIHGVRAARAAGDAAPAWPAFGLLAALAAALAHAQVDAFAALPDLAAWNWMALGLLAAGLSSPHRRSAATPQ